MCASAGWPCTEFDSVRRTRRLLGRIRPKVIVTRFKLTDGYSDDILNLAAPLANEGKTRVMVLIAAGSPADLEVRQVRMGADVVLRDPIRADVAIAYLGRFRDLSSKDSVSAAAHHGSPARLNDLLEVAGAEIDVLARTLRHSGKSVALTPKETSFIQVLTGATDQVVTYEVLYSELMERRFNGDTSNMRVLLGKLCQSFKSIGIELRPWIEVIPKTGYRYLSKPRA
jgi:DNA-binding response OmpR family regulator